MVPQILSGIEERLLLPTALLNKKLLVFFFRLGLATAPVLFAADEREELDSLINRRFSQEGKSVKIVQIKPVLS